MLFDSPLIRAHRQVKGDLTFGMTSLAILGGKVGGGHEGVHGGWRMGNRNPEGESVAHDLVVTNNFQKENCWYVFIFY